jgi:predicted nucleic acid-binding protein
MTSPKLAQVSMEEATSMLSDVALRPGYHFHPIPAGWQALCQRFSKRLFGHNQITDAYLLGLAVHEGLVLVTFDKAIVHLAAQYGSHVLLLTQ